MTFWPTSSREQAQESGREAGKPRGKRRTLVVRRATCDALPESDIHARKDPKHVTVRTRVPDGPGELLVQILVVSLLRVHLELERLDAVVDHRTEHLDDVVNLRLGRVDDGSVPGGDVGAENLSEQNGNWLVSVMKERATTYAEEVGDGGIGSAELRPPCATSQLRIRKGRRRDSRSPVDRRASSRSPSTSRPRCP